MSSPNTVYQLMSYNDQLLAVQQYFTNIAAVQNGAALKQIWLFESIGGMLLMCRNSIMRVYEARIERYGVLC